MPLNRNQIAARGGYALSQALKSTLPGQQFDTWADVVAALAEGPVAVARCLPAGARSMRKHRIRFHPDGRIEPVTHPQPDGVDPAAEQMLAALGGQVDTCRATVTYLPDRLPMTKAACPSGHQMVALRLRALHAAVAWAQEPDTVWDGGRIDGLLRAGVTPAVVAEWADAGWTVRTALPFWRHFVPLSLAEQWREAGRTTARDAKVAGRGEHPDEEDRWAAVGFTVTGSARWRSSGMTPEQAWEWESANFSPFGVRDLLRRADGSGDRTLVDRALTWGRAGVPGTQVLDWMQSVATPEEAVDWISLGVHAGAAPGFADLLARIEPPTFTRETIRRWTALGFTSPDQVLTMTSTRVTPEVYEQVLTDLANPVSNLLELVEEQIPPDRFARMVEWEMRDAPADTYVGAVLAHRARQSGGIMLRPVLVQIAQQRVSY